MNDEMKTLLNTLKEEVASNMSATSELLKSFNSLSDKEDDKSDKKDDNLPEDYVDVTSLFKSVIDTQVGLSATIGQITEGFGKFNEAVNAKLTANDEVIKSLTDRIEVLANTGKGRKAVINIQDKGNTDLQDVKDTKNYTVEDVLNKAIELQGKGKFSAFDVARLELNLNAGRPIPADMIKQLSA